MVRKQSQCRVLPRVCGALADVALRADGNFVIVRKGDGPELPKAGSLLGHRGEEDDMFFLELSNSDGEVREIRRVQVTQKGCRNTRAFTTRAQA